jgi:ElaA protein
MMIEWQWSSFDELSKGDLYEVLERRQEVFVVEQNCIFQDIDHVDQQAFHLLGWKHDGAKRQLVAYLRCVFPGVKYPEISLGRVLSTSAVRGTGIGREMMTQAISHAERQFPGLQIRISAQQYLETFYRSFGFETTTEPYDEDGIPHVEMLR